MRTPTTSQARRFMKICRDLKISTHATFVLGLPGETRDTIKQTISFVKELDPDTIQVSIASPYPGTELYEQAIKSDWFVESDLVSCSGVQQVSLEYENLTGQEIYDAVETLYNKFYFRPRPIIRILGTMIRDKEICKRRLREAKEFFGFMRDRKRTDTISLAQ